MQKTIASGTESNRGELRRVLTKWDATALIVGIMIGSGIFATPPQIAASLDRFGPMIAIWLVGGVLAVCGALTYAEPAAMFPRTGGSFVFLHEAYGPLPAFIYGWSALLITYPASIAAVAVVFSAYLARLFPGLPVPQSLVAALLSVFLCGLNARGVILGARVQSAATAAKVGALVALVGAAVFTSAGNWENLRPLISAPSSGWHLSALALALASVMWTYEGWSNGPTLSGEVRHIRTDLPRALLLGTALVTVIYVLVNAGYAYVLTIPGIAGSDSVAVDMASRGLGAYGGVFVNLLVLVSTLGSINGMVIGGSRVFFAMARAGLFFAAVGYVHRRFATPANALAILAVVSAGYCLLGTFEQIIRYFVFVSTIWYVLVIASVYVLRIRRPDLERPFRVPLYPITPALFLLVALGLMYQLLRENTRDSLIGLAILLVSIPAYFLWRRWRGSPS
ncbi:MAG: amino acid permease [Candidatus Zixiibacteriota bacterium]